MDKTNSEFLSDSFSSSFFPIETPLITEDHHELEIISSHSEYEKEEDEEEKMEEITTSSTAVTSSLVETDFLESREDSEEEKFIKRYMSNDENALIKRIKNLFQSFTEDEECFTSQSNFEGESSYVSASMKKRNKSAEAFQGNCRVCQREKIKCPVK
jgi:G:T/U-mismatch repair DNA glycosylase